MLITIKKDDEVVKEMEVNKSTNGTYYIDLEKGNYSFVLSSDITFKAELLFNWKYDK